MLKIEPRDYARSLRFDKAYPTHSSACQMDFWSSRYDYAKSNRLGPNRGYGPNRVGPIGSSRPNRVGSNSGYGGCVDSVWGLSTAHLS